MTARIVIADDHPLFRTAMRHAVGRVWPDAEIVEAASAADARAAMADGADAVLLDLHMQDSHGLSALMDLRQDFPAVPIIIVSASESPRVFAAARQLGAAAFIPKTASLDAIREARSIWQWFQRVGAGSGTEPNPKVRTVSRQRARALHGSAPVGQPDFAASSRE